MKILLHNSEKNTVVSIKPSTAIRLLLMILFLCVFVNVASAQTNIWDGSSSNNWNTAANWNQNHVPTSAEDVVIPNGFTVTVNVNAATCKSLSVSGSLTIGNNNNNRNLTVSGNVTINSGGAFNSGGDGGNALLIGGNLVNDGAFDMNVGAADTDVTFNGASTQTISGVGSLMDFNSLTLTNNPSNFFINRAITVNRDWINNGKTVLGTGIVTLTGTSIIGGSAETNFPNLTVTGTVTQKINTIVSGDFILNSGTYIVNNNSSSSLTINGNYLQSGGLFDFNSGTSGTSTMNLSGNLTNTVATTDSMTTSGSGAPNGQIVFNGSATQNITYTVPTASIWTTYTINTGSTVKLASNITLLGDSSNIIFFSDFIVNGIIDLGTFILKESSTNGSHFTLNSGGGIITANPAGITSSGATGSVQVTNTRTFSTTASYTYNGSSTQVTGSGLPFTVSNLTINNSIGVTLEKATTITNNFYIITGSKANLGTFTHTAGTLTIGDEGAVAGSWGSTSSPATNTNNTFFAATTGIVNVSTSSCTTTTWNGISWSKGTPTADQKLIFEANYSENTNIVGCSCQVNDGVFVTIAANRTLTLTNELNVIGNGTLAFEYGASLVQINNVATNNNTGDIQYKRSTYSRLTDYNYLSSPVSPSIGALGPQTLGEIATDLLNGTFYSYEATNAGEDWKEETVATIMEPGKGYIATRSSAIPQANASVLPLDLIFSGIPNNGHYETSIIEDRSYLLGNPYPSALDAETFLERNSGVLNGTLYFWTHNTPMQDRNLISSTAGSGAYAYTSDDYATYNATGGVATTQLDIDPATGLPRPGSAIISSASGGIINTNIPTGKIASGQGFFASTKIVTSGNKIVFDNDMRVGVIDLTKENNSQFFKTRNPNGKTTKTKALEKNRVWLNMTNTEGAFKQTLVGYITDATNDYDDRFDGESFDGNEFIDFYSLNQDLNLTIQGRALPFDENDEVPLGYRTTINGDFTINIAQVDGLLANQAVFLEDKLTNTVTDLKSGNYTFNTAEGTFNDRFVLKYTNKTLSLDTTDKEDGILAFYSNNYKTLIIKNNLAEATVNSVALFNMIGQKIENWDVSESEQTDVQIPIKNMSSGIYVVKIKTTKGESSKKIIVN